MAAQAVSQRMAERTSRVAEAYELVNRTVRVHMGVRTR